ncbi:MAG: insulinase family protein [Anaerolineae bacterium]|nr:insulinase family protein [Anaerolineae bacterium]
MSNVFRHVLSNGLVVLLKPVRTAPIISWWVLYRIGSRNEPTGITGASHWVEHMLFKGTDQFPAGYLDKAIDRVGGSWNAQTFFDYTAYYETLPAAEIDLALRLEADRMINARFDVEEVESERTVIISERQGAENSPMFWLGEEVQASVFRVHGYHHEIIGDMTDLRTMTRDDLFGHYRQHYMPNNAIAVAVGDFDPDEMLERIRAIYEPIPAGAAPALFVRPEPVQQGERRVTVERHGTTSFIQLAYRVPAATDPDWFKLELLNSVLAGTDGFGGGGIDNRTTRLYKSLVETQLAVDVDGGMTPTIDPFMYTITVVLRDGVEHQTVQNALDEAINRVIAEGVTERELERAKKQARALFAYGTERVTMQAFWLAFAENFNSYSWFEDYVQSLETVTLDDVKEVAARYLRAQNRTVGWFVPTTDAAQADAEQDEEDFE